MELAAGRGRGYSLFVSPLTPEILDQRLAVLATAGERLRRRSLPDVLAVLDRAVTPWLEAHSVEMTEALRQLPHTTGFSQPMLRHALPLLLAPLRAEAIAGVIDAELGRCERPPADRLPNMLLHVLSGNLPALGVRNTVLALALGVPIAIKPAAGDPLFPHLFAESLARVDAEVAAAHLVADWRGGEQDIEAVAFSRPDVVTAFGSDTALAQIAARVRGKFIGHGHKISFAVIDAPTLRDASMRLRAADALAYDMSLWDQLGCLSPQLCYVEGGDRSALEIFLEELAKCLTYWARELPPRHREFADHAAIQRFRQDAEWAEHSPGLPSLVQSLGTTDWTITVEPNATFLPTCLYRAVRLKVVPDFRVLPEVLQPHRSLLEAAGLAVDEWQTEAMTRLLRHSGVPRICPLGTMQLPGLEWHQGGRRRVSDWLVDRPSR